MKRLLVPGVFDVFHIGHLNYLKTASRHGDYVIAGVQDDRSVFQSKGVKPVIPLPERMAILEELRCVDEVVSYTSVFQGQLLAGLGIQVFAVGDEYGQSDQNPDQRRSLDYCAEHGIEVVRIPRTPLVSSTQIRGQLKDFWNSRARLRESLPAGVTVLGSFGGDSDKINRETLHEVELILKAVADPANKSVLDLGCGDGRLLVHLCGRFERVVGVDFSQGLLKIAAERTAAVGRAAELAEADVSEFRSAEPFDVLLLSGIMPYLDDQQLVRTFENLKDMSHDATMLLIRNSIGVNSRINVVNQFSQELNARYTAYYRTISEMESLLADAGWGVAHKRPLYQHREDTAIWWFECARAHAGVIRFPQQPTAVDRPLRRFAA